MCDENNKTVCNADALSHDVDVTVMCGVVHYVVISLSWS